jgi:hypothetical protein
MVNPYAAAADPSWNTRLGSAPSRFLNPKDFENQPIELARTLREWAINFDENKHFLDATGAGVPRNLGDAGGRFSPIPYQEGTVYTVRAPKGAAFPATYGDTRTKWIDTPSGVKGIRGQTVKEPSHPLTGNNMYDDLEVHPAPPGMEAWSFMAQSDPVYEDSVRRNLRELGNMYFASGGRTAPFYPRTGWYPQGVTESQFYGAASAGNKVNKNAKKPNKR